MSRFASALEGSDHEPGEYKGHYKPEDLHTMCAGEPQPFLRCSGRCSGSSSPLSARAAFAEMLEKAGGTPEDSDYVAETLINASLAGVDSHGIIRMERYVRALVACRC